MKTYSIQEVAKQFNIRANKLRFYEKKGLLIPKRNPLNDYRQYSIDDISVLHTILLYRSLQVSIDEIKTLLNDYSEERVIDHLYNLSEGINDQYHHYRVLSEIIQSSLDRMDQEDGRSLNDKLSQAVDQINKQGDLRNSWIDQWQFDVKADKFDDDVARHMTSEGRRLNVYKQYGKVIQALVDKGQGLIDGKRSRCTILDIGVGTGKLIKAFMDCDEEEASTYIGVDPSKNMLKLAKAKCSKLSCRMGEFLKLPVDTNSVDLVISSYAFHHLKNYEKIYALDEMARILKQGGQIIIGDLMFVSESSRMDFYVSLSQEDIETVEDEYYGHVDLLIKACEDRSWSVQHEQLDEITGILHIFV